MSVVDILGVAFVILKLTKHIDWSWWLVLSPFFVRLSVMIVMSAWETYAPRSYYKFWLTK